MTTPLQPVAGLGWRPRLVALDVDGTLVDRDGVLGADMADALRRVVAAGVPVVLAAVGGAGPAGQ